MDSQIKLLDCTLRDGGYYNSWNFDPLLIGDYLQSMSALGVAFVEIGLRSLRNDEFKGACAFSTEDFLSSLDCDEGISLGVMVNAAELMLPEKEQQAALAQLFPLACDESRVDIVRVACHVHEFERALPASRWLKDLGFTVGFNIMQIADRDQGEVETLSRLASEWPLDVLYFADSMGGMDPDQAGRIISWLRKYWEGPMGIHTHDNMGLALQNTLHAIDNGVTWVDATVTGMGRGPGNAKTEYVALELERLDQLRPNITPLMGLIRKHFGPLQVKYGWGTNTFYYLSGKYGIHPTYIQEMLGDSRYDEEDVLAVIDHLRIEGGKKYSANTLDAARHFYSGEPRGSWRPSELFENRDIVILGAGPGVSEHRNAIESFIRSRQPVVLALNTQGAIDSDLIDARVACHPVRLLADCDAHCQLPQPLITPASMLPEDVSKALAGKELLDFGLGVQSDTFSFQETWCVLPSSLVVAYALAAASSGRARRIMLCGFDGYGADDPRTREMQNLFDAYSHQAGAIDICSITPTNYSIPTASVYAL